MGKKNVVSKQELDALLPEQEEEHADLPEGASLHDFNNPRKLAEEQVSQLQALHQDFLQQSSIVLSVLSQTAVEAKLTGLEQITFRDFLAKVPPITCLGVAHFEATGGRFGVELSKIFVFTLLDRLLGGVSPKGSDVNREFTEIEMRVAQQIMGRLLTSLGRVWLGGDGSGMVLDDIQTTPRYVKIASANEGVIVVAGELVIGKAKAEIRVCYPLSTIGIIANSFVQASASSDGEERDIMAAMLDVPLTLRAILGRSELELEQFFDLEVGDVVKLDREIDIPVDLFVGTEHFGTGRPGVVKDSQSLSLTSVLEDQIDG